MSQPYDIFGSQKSNDDDGQVIDSFFIETDAPPDLTFATEPIPPTSKIEPVKCGRLLTGSLSMTTAVFTSPTLILPADANRKQVSLSVSTDGPVNTASQSSATGTVVSGTAYLKSVTLASTDGVTSGVGKLEIRDGAAGPVLLTLRVAQDVTTEWTSGDSDGIKFTTGIHGTLSGTGPGNLVTWVYSTTTDSADYVLISDENGKVLGNSGFNLRPGKDPINLQDYTGAIYAMPASGISGAIELSWIAVTQ
jgi:hypothetical protein